MIEIKSKFLDAKAWPFQEAKKIVQRHKDNSVPSKGHVLFATGYGPSGLPHIGTFGEVARTSMVRRAFSELSDFPTKLFAFSDDMDGLRRLPENIPNKELIQPHIDKPLTKVPDPFGIYESFGHHNNAMLRKFLDEFSFDYEFVSATTCYQSGKFDETLVSVLQNYDAIMAIILPTLGEERKKTYSPFLPVCPDTDKVLQVPIIERNIERKTIVYLREDGKKIETLITGGSCKLQWKVDWAMRWKAFEVDYEMSGKDLIESVKSSSKICKVLNGKPPEGFSYELFLDENGEKISKSRGNGISIEEWLTYASPESLSLFMYQSPRKAKRLYFDIIPKTVGEYLDHLNKYYDTYEESKKIENPVWHVHKGSPPLENVTISFSLLLNLASVCGTESPDVLWGFINRYDKHISREQSNILNKLLAYAIIYYKDFIKPQKKFRRPNDKEKKALLSLKLKLEELSDDVDRETIQNLIYSIGKEYNYLNLRDWFKAQYEILFGQTEGPRIGSFVELYGIKNYAKLIEDSIKY